MTLKLKPGVWSGLATLLVWALAQGAASAFVYENDLEFVTDGDFDGDGRTDLVIVDKASGKYRLGYQLGVGTFVWKEFRATGIKYISGISVGRLIDPKRDAIALTSADSNQSVIIDAATGAGAVPPIAIPIEVQGPNVIAAVDIGGAGNTPVPDIYLGSIYNASPENQVTLYRNAGGKVARIADVELTGAPGRFNRIALKQGQPEVLGVVISSGDSATFRAEKFGSGRPEAVVTASGLPAGSSFITGNFRGQPLADLVFFKPGANALIARPVEESGGAFKIGEGKSFDLGKPVQQVFTLPEAGANKLLVLSGEGETADVFKFDGASAPSAVLTLPAKEGEKLIGAAVVTNGFFLFSAPKNGKYSYKYQLYDFSGSTNSSSLYGTLPSLADSDDATVPDIQKRILTLITAKTESEMKPYTNIIPGTTVSYVMVPIPGGEFTRGSPDGEAGRKPDESPAHKVRIEPFWMERCEVTWNEYELFMYSEDEKKLRQQFPTDPEVDKVSDAVSRPSKPYVEMSFGMGRDGYPAISMTQHGANKYCHWLSAKTGHYYRLPTEAEWEYACRAGTTTAYSYGDDPAKLGDYAWFEMNSDFKYQKVGKKKPNPWGLHDMHGNVLEWCADQYEENYNRFKDGVAQAPWVRATTPYPHSARGGSYDDTAEMLRSAARRGSDRTWKMTDPQLPKSVWYHSDAKFIGFRIVRPLKVPPPEEMRKYWTSGVEKD